jgi:hypothetical protein
VAVNKLCVAVRQPQKKTSAPNKQDRTVAVAVCFDMQENALCLARTMLN